MVNRDLQAVKAAISQQNTMQKRMEKMQMRSLYANNTAESLIKSAKKAGYTVPASAYQPVQQTAPQQTPQQSGGITADSLMKEYQQWLNEQQNTQQDLSSGGSAGSGYRQTLTTQDQQIPSLMDSVKNMSNDDIAKQINIANMVKDQKAQTQEEQEKNVADILSKLNSDSSMADKARQLLNQRNADYTSQTGKTDYDEAVQRTLQSAIPSLADNQPQAAENAKKTAQTNAQSYSNEAIAKIMADAGGGDEKTLLDQLNNDPELAKQAQSVLNQRDSDYAALTKKEPETQPTTQRTSKQAKQAQSAYKQAQTATRTAKKKLETEQKKIDQSSQKLQSLQNSLAKAKKTAQKTGHYEQVNAIQQQIRGLQDTSADNKAFKKATEEYNKAKFNERAAKLKWANQALENPVTKNGKVLNVTAKPNDDQTLSTAQNLVSAAQNGKLTKSQKSEAKTLAKHYEDKIRKATLNGQSVSDDEMKTYTALKNATSAGASFMSGLANAFSTTKRMAQGVGNAIGKLTGEDNAGDELSQELQTTQETANNQNGIANVAGTMVGKGAQYALFNQLANAAGLTPAISNTMNEKLGLNAANVANTAKGVAGKKLTEQLADVIVGQAADTAFDTIPTIMDNVSTGKYAGDAGQLVNDVSANQMNNLAMNMGMNTIQSGVIPSISDALKNLLGKGQTAEDAVSNIAKNAAYTNDSNRTQLAYQSSEDAAEEARRMLSDELARQRVSVQSPEDANKEASDILSQYMNDTRGKENVQTGINNFINKAQNAQYPDEQAGSIVSAAKQNQKEIPSVKDAVEDSNVTNSIKGGSDWNPNKRISEILGRDVTMASDMKDGSVSLTEKIPSIDDGAPRKAGRATTIYHPYKGEVPVQSTTSGKRTVISEGAISNSAENLKLATTENGNIDRGVLKRLYSKIFSDKGGQRKITVDGVEFNGQPYDVSINNSSVGKIARSNLSKEQLSVFEDIDNVVKNGEYVGSADFVQHHAKNKNVLRYDYFETPVEIDGKDYVVTYDVEVYKGTNNYRTHKVIDEINLTERSSAPSSKGILNERVRQLPDISPDAPTQSSLSKADSKRVNANLNGSPSPTSKNVSSVEPSSIPSIDSTGKNVNSVDELNKRGQDAFDQLVNDVKNSEGKANDIPSINNEKVYTTSGTAEKEVDPEDAVDLMSERMSKRKNKTDNEGYIGRGYTNTIKNSGLATDKQYAKGLDEQTRHFTVSEKESFETGKAIYDSNPKAFVQKYSSSMEKDQLKNLGSSDIDAMHIAYGKLNQMAKNATDPAEAESLRRQASNIARNLTDAQHYNAQTLQANAKWRNNIDGALMSADGTMKRLRDEALSPREHSQIDDASQKISEMLKKMLDGKMETTSDNQLAWQEVKNALDGYSQLKGKFTDKQIQNLTDSVLKDKDWNGIQDLLEMQMTGYGGVSSEAIDKATMLFDEAQKYNYNSRKYMDLEQEAYNVLAKDIQSQPGYKGASFGKKMDSLRYLMMLGNPKTQIKNIAGNVLFGKLTDLKDDIGALIETAVDRANRASGGEGIQKTKSILNPFSESDRKLVSAAKEYGEEYAARELSGNKYTNPGVELDKALSTFGNGKVGKFVQGLSDLTTKSLDKADQKAMMNKYQNALARYVKANGKDISIFSDTSQEAKDFLSMASDYAVRQAEEAAFHQDSGLASGLTNFATMLKNGNACEKAAGTLIDATVPFKKTPINVLKSCLQYSPAEYAYAFADAYKLHRGEIDAAKFIDDMAKATTGTTMCGVGAVLAHEGIVQIGSDKGTKEQNTDTRTGRQQMAVKIGKHYVNLSDLVPAASPLIIGATMYEAFKKNGKGIDALIDGLSNVESGLVDTTMLSGLSSVLNSVQYMQQGEEPINAVTRSVAESYAGQFLPTLGRAINSTVDDTQRSSYSSKTGVGKEVESTAKYLETKIPGLQQVGDWADKNNIPVLNKLKLQPAIDAWGNVKKQNSAGVDAYTDNKVANAVGRGVANFATPTKLSADKSADLDNKIRELKERLVSNGEMSAEDADNLFPYTATSEAKIGGEKLSEKDWTQYQIDKGTTSAELAKELLTSGNYDDLSDTDKADILQKIYKFSKSNTAAEYGGSASSSNSKLSKAYKNGGAKAVIDSLIGSSEKSSFTNAVQASNSEGKASIDNVIDYLNAVEKKDPAQAKELASQASEYQSGTYKKQSGKWVYQNKNTTKTGTGKAVTIPGPDEVGLPKASTKASTETTANMSGKLSEARKNKDKAIAAINRGESADSAVVNAGYWANRNYESRYSKYSAAKIPGLSKSEENFKLIYQTMDSDRNGNLKKKEVVDYINSQNLTAEQKRAMFSAFANKNWKNPY